MRNTLWAIIGIVNANRLKIMFDNFVSSNSRVKKIYDNRLLIVIIFGILLLILKTKVFIMLALLWLLWVMVEKLIEWMR